MDGQMKILVGQALIEFEPEISLAGPIGKPLIAEKLRRIRSSEDVVPLIYTGLILDKLSAEYEPKRPFAKMRRELTPIGNGIFKKVISEGYGDAFKDKSRITVKYTMFQENKEYLPNSTYLTNKPFTFILGTDSGILPGFELAVKSMKNQEKAGFLVPHALLYGVTGFPPHIAPRQDSYFVIEVISAMETMIKQDKVRMLTNFELTLKKVLKLRDKAKNAFDAEFFRVAIDLYNECASLLINVLVQTKEDNNKRMENLLLIFLYTGMAYNKLDEPMSAAQVFLKALQLQDSDAPVSTSVKGKLYLHTCRAYRLLFMPSDAYQYFKKAKKVIGDNPAMQEEFKKLCELTEKEATCDLVCGCARVDARTPKVPKSCITPKIFYAVFELQLLTFMCSKERTKVFYAMSFKENLTEAQDLAQKYKKLTMDVMKNDNMTVTINLSKK